MKAGQVLLFYPVNQKFESKMKTREKVARQFLLASGFLLANGFSTAQEFNPVEEFDAIFTPLEQVEGSVCAQYHNWNPDTVQPLFRDQVMLFRQAYAAVSAADDDWLRTLVTDSATYLDMYGFMSNVRQLAQNNMGVKYMYQERYDENIEQHRLMGERLSEKPDVIVGIFWCQPTGEATAPRYTGGYAYLRVVDGEWKFHTR